MKTNLFPRRSGRVLAASILALATLPGCETTEHTETETRDVDLNEAQGIEQQDSAPAQQATSPTPETTDEGTRTVTGGFTIVHNDWKKIGYRWDWTGFPALERGEHVVRCDVYDDIVVAQGDRSSITVVESRSGRTRWSDRLSNPLTRFVGMTRDGDTLYICAESEAYIIDARSGNWINRQRLTEVVNTAPVLWQGNLIFGTASGRVLAHRIDFGLTAWQYDVGAPVVADPVLVGPAIGVISESGQGLFIAPHTATALGRPTTGAGLATNPVTDGARMYVASLDQSAYAFVPGEDSHLWRYRTEEELTTQPTLHAGVFYLSVPHKGLVALDPDDGSEIWIGPDAEGQVVASRAGSLIVWDGTAIKSVDPTNGDVIEAFDAPGLTMLKTDNFDDGNLIGITHAGGIIRMVPR